MGDPGADWDSLRDLLIGPEPEHLTDLRARVADPVRRAEDLGEVLPRVLQQHAHDPHLVRALTPPLEKALAESIQRNPQPMADALFPVMGPAIRKAVSASLAGLVESLNRTLEHSLSWQSVQWRLEGWRTGRSFGEIVLLKTLVYRVEQIFLIDRKTGLLLQHVHAGAGAVQDANMVSGMLTAIRDFAQDSFKVTENASLETIQVGDLAVWIEPGPHAILAAAIRGTAPREFRRVLQDALETIHLEFGAALESFNGDASTLEGARPSLEVCLHTEYKQSERHPRGRGTWLLFGAVALVLLVWFGFAYRARTRWAHYLDALRAQPGIVVVSAERRGGRFVVSGLRDPLAPDPQTLVAPTGLSPDDVVGMWAPYQALDPPLVLERARRVLQPPYGVALALHDGVLSVTGATPVAWIGETQKVAPLIAGVTRFDAAGAFDLAIQSTANRINSRTLFFVKGASQLVAGQEDDIRRLVSDLRLLESQAVAAGRRLTLSVVGHTDADGPSEANVPLSRERANVVAAIISGAAVPHLQVAPDGVGSSAPAAAGQDEADNQKNRRVTIRVKAAGAN